MKAIHSLFASVSLLILFHTNTNAAEVMFSYGRTSYRIVLPQNASETEKTAATELKNYLEQISGAHFTLSSTPGRRNIYVGFDKKFSIYRGIEPYDDESDGFSIKKINHDLVIYGGRERGTMYGVFRFLQKYFDVQWYTPNYTKIPAKKKFYMDNISLSEAPAIKYRYTDYFCAQDIPWMAHNYMNTKGSNVKNSYGIASRYWGTHSMAKLLPASKYFKGHPEYFAYRKLRRVESGQPCLSNPDVLKIITKELLATIEKYPNFVFYDVSQLDNQNFCTCKKCVALENKYGGHSGLMIWFVNQVARKIKQRYPNKYIGTFAYQYTRHAPTNIKPDENVVVRLCDIECCFIHPLSSGCNEHNVAFLKDLKDWSKISKNLYIWDYIVNYGNYMAPFPNIQVLGPNLKTFAKYGVVEVFEEAQSETLGNAFEELKCWVLAQLMWNPDQNTNKLVATFINDYYGSAAKDVIDYYNLCLKLIRNDSHMTCFSDPNKPPFTDEFIDKAYRILDKALSHANSETISERVRKVMLQPMALECARHPQQFYKKGKWPVFKSQLQRYNSYFKVGTSSKKFIESYESNKIACE